MEAVLDVVLEYVIEIVMLAIFAGIGFLAKKVNDRADRAEDKEKDGKDLGIIDSLAKRSVEFVESEFDGFLGSDKFGESTQKLSELLNNYGIPVSESMLTTSVQNAWRKMDSEQRQNGVKDEDIDDGDDDFDDLEEDDE